MYNEHHASCSDTNDPIAVFNLGKCKCSWRDMVTQLQAAAAEQAGSHQSKRARAHEEATQNNGSEKVRKGAFQQEIGRATAAMRQANAQY